jgi:hypothetical protein
MEQRMHGKINLPLEHVEPKVCTSTPALQTVVVRLVVSNSFKKEPSLTFDGSTFTFPSFMSDSSHL